jgi:activator of HSP90 ATPase
MRDAVEPARRQIVAGTICAFAGLTLARAVRAASADDEISRTGETIHQEVVFHTRAKRVYAALTSTAQFNEVIQLSAAVKSGMALGNRPTEINAAEGGSFIIFGGHIVGRQIELVPDERIVQAWRVVDWAPGVYSIARFVLNEQGSDTKLIFDHSSFPQGQAQHLADGWKENYWGPLAKFLKK